MLDISADQARETHRIPPLVRRRSMIAAGVNPCTHAPTGGMPQYKWQYGDFPPQNLRFEVTP